MITVSKNDNLKTRIKNITGITMGNAIEFYDFGIYTVFVVLLGKLYFPADSELAQQLFTFGSIGVGFITRPIGAVCIGLYADKFGRKPALLLTLFLMGLGTLIFVLTPTYQTIGIAAPILILFARLLQGFSLGGELGSSTTMLMEYANDNSRAFYGSWQMFGQNLNKLLASLIGGILGILLSPEALSVWGWRLAFSVGLIIIPIALYIRRNLPETKAKEKSEANEKAILHELFQDHIKTLIAGILLVLGITTATYIIAYYIANYAATVLKMDFKYTVWAVTVSAIVQVILSPFLGLLTDKIGRKQMIFWTRMGIVLFIYPAFLLINKYPEPYMLYTVVGILAFFLVGNSIATIVMCAEIFPSRIRATGLSISYSFTVMIFGGFAQFFATLLIQLTGNPLSPSFYIIVTGLISLIGLLLVKETAGKPLE